ncbi:protein SFI1 homolog isoform X1 [Hippocampus zosterae]|uniref:protein SFI1 homolog isoform X1 n=1 Tax=Hippocampus zosterae TaxID=109293 RepID=UPI00223DE726|nr:protein SFI1 homolog isoform X1 [Hippocampus zosterae]
MLFFQTPHHGPIVVCSRFLPIMEKEHRLQKRKLHNVRFSVDTKGCAVQSISVPKSVGYSWDKCGRIYELRIRHLARKFLKIWRQNTFGRILPHKAKCHYDSVLLRKAFEGWTAEWWASGREWSLSVRAECHYRYYLLFMTFRRWQTFISLQVEKKSKVNKAQAFADRRRVRQIWDKWELFIQIRRLKNKALQIAQEQHRGTILQSAWCLWQARLQEHRNISTMEDQTLKHAAVTIQSRIEKESKASLHFNNGMQKKSLTKWQGFVSRRQHKKALQAIAHVHLMRLSWRVWRSEWHRKQGKEECLQGTGQLASRLSQCRVPQRWKAYVIHSKEKADRGQIASQHYHQRLQRAVFQVLSQNVSKNRAKRLNKNTAVQHHNQTVQNRHWRLWKDRLEEAEDKRLQALTGMAQKNYRTYLLSRTFDHWRRKLAQQRHIQELEWRAEVWFAEHCLAHYFNSWCEYILQRRAKKARSQKADVYNKQRLCTWVLGTLRERSDQHKDEMLLLRIAILHEEQSHVQRAWARWRQRTEQQKREEKGKQQVQGDQYQDRLPHTPLAQQKDTSPRVQARTNEQQAGRQDDLHCMRWALDSWKKFVQRQKFQQCHEKEIAKHSLWKLQYRLEMSDPTERALWHWALTLQAKALYGWRLWVTEKRRKKVEASKPAQAWREETKCAMSDHHHKRKAFTGAERSFNPGELLQRERVGTEKAQKHYDSNLLSKALREWKKHHHTCLKYKVMKRQGILLLRLKMYQTYFVLWRRKFLLKVKVSVQTEQALWHWALTLQAKVLYAWRLWVTAQRRKKTEAWEAAQVDKDESQSAVATYSQRMNSIWGLAEPGMKRDEERQSLFIQRMVKCCAMKWKQRALCKAPKTTVTFPCSDLKSGKCDTDDSEPMHPFVRRQPRRCEEVFAPSLKALPYDNCQTSAGVDAQLGQRISSLQTDLALSSSSIHQPSIPVDTACLSGDVRHGSPQKSPAPILDPPQTPCELLLPPAAFISTENKTGRANISSPIAERSFEHFSSTPLEIHPREPNGESANDATSSLMKELMSIQQDMNSFQQDRKQLRLWQRMKDVLQSWLQTSGKDQEMDKNAVCQEVKELEERIEKLSCDLETRRLTMRFHAERLQHLQAVLDRSGFSSLYRQVQM